MKFFYLSNELFTMRVLLRKLVAIKSINCVRSLKNTAEIHLQDTQKEKWDIYSAVSLERKPIITRDLNELESKFHDLLLRIEYEKSQKSNFEIRVQNDEKRAKEVKEGNISITEMDGFPQQTAQDFIDASLEELRSFQFANRKNDSIERDTKSTKRAMDEYLLLLVKENIGQKPQWVLPQGIHKTGETLRETAERILREKCGVNINSKFMGNAPCGFYRYRYPKVIRKGSTVGAKIFFFKANYMTGHVEIGKEHNCADYMWATRDELEALHYDYLKSVKMFLIDEKH